MNKKIYLIQNKGWSVLWTARVKFESLAWLDWGF